MSDTVVVEGGGSPDTIIIPESGADTIIVQGANADTVITEGAFPDLIVVQDVGGDTIVVQDARPDTLLVPQSAPADVIVTQGATGPPGPPGASAAHLRVDVAIPNTVWILNHPFHAYPDVRTFDTSSPPREMEGDVTYPSLDVAQVTFAVPVAGFAALS